MWRLEMKIIFLGWKWELDDGRDEELGGWKNFGKCGIGPALDDLEKR